MAQIEKATYKYFIWVSWCLVAYGFELEILEA